MENKLPRILVCTTFANKHWEEHAQRMIHSFDEHWPREVGLFVELDDQELFPHLQPIINVRGGALGTFGDDQRFQDFKAKYEKLDHPTDYRKQFFRFSHKIFALDDAMTWANEAGYDYVVWLDADVLTDKDIPFEKLMYWLPEEGQIVSYLGRKDWPHSECGFMAFRVEHGSVFLKSLLEEHYLNGRGQSEQQSDDSWLFDVERKKWEMGGDENISLGGQNILRFKNLTPTAPGMNVWLNSPLQAYMSHHKGPVAKNALGQTRTPTVQEGGKGSPPPKGMQPLDVKIRNCLPHEEIRNNVSDNLALIPRWLPDCTPSQETVVMVSGGPTLDVDKVAAYARQGYRIVCVKHALGRLLAANIVPWGCVLLDPRLHVENFVDKPDPRINWFVASMVNPKVTQKLLENGCKIWGYHAAVGADEHQYVAKGTPYIGFGSASAVRGLFVMKALGFSRFILLGYDLCYPSKPDLNEKMPDGNKKYLEVVLEQPTWGGGKAQRTFWTEGQLLAQLQELERVVGEKAVEITAEGEGIVPWVLGEKKRFKQWQEKIYAPLTKHRPSADEAVGRAGWRNWILHNRWTRWMKRLRG